MVLITVVDFGNRLLDSVGHAFDVLLGFIPSLIGALLLVVIGWIVAGIVANIVKRLLQAAHFDQLMQHAGIDRVASQLGLSANANDLLAGLVLWFIRLIFLVAASNALQIPAISNILNAILFFLPTVIVALLIVIIGASLARVAREAMSRSALGGSPLLGAVVQYSIITIALFIALEQIGVGTTILTILFGAVMLAGSIGVRLAFGLGGRDTAKQIVDTWYSQMNIRTQPAHTLPERVSPQIPSNNA